MADGAEGDDGIASGDEKIDGAVVQHLHHLLGHGGLQSVVDAGDAVQHDQAGAVDGGSQNLDGTVEHHGLPDAEDQGDHTADAAQNVGDGVGDLLPETVAGQDPVLQLHTFDHSITLLWISFHPYCITATGK